MRWAPSWFLALARLPALILATALITWGVSIGVCRVFELEIHELEHISSWQPLEPAPGPLGEVPHRELSQVELDEGEAVLFEVCTDDGLGRSAWKGALELIVLHMDSDELVLKTPLNGYVISEARRTSNAACLVIGRGGKLRIGGRYAVAAAWPGRKLPASVRGIPVRARVLAHTPLTPGDLSWMLVLLLGSLVVALALMPWNDRLVTTGPPTPSPPDPAIAFGASPEVLRIVLALGALCCLASVLVTVPISGAVGGLARSLTVAAVEVALAFLLIRAVADEHHGRCRALGLVQPLQASWLLWWAPAVGLVLWLAGRHIVYLLPVASTPAIEAVVPWPSERLAVAIVAIVVPVAEELFFRGFLYGTLARRFSHLTACVGTSLIFITAHTPQCWGSWGSLAAVGLTGVVLTVLRWRTGSVVASTLAHIAHNGAITIVAVASSALT